MNFRPKPRAWRSRPPLVWQKRRNAPWLVGHLAIKPALPSESRCNSPCDRDHCCDKNADAVVKWPTSARTSMMAVARSMVRSSAICRSSLCLWASKASSVVFMREGGVMKSFNDLILQAKPFLSSVSICLKSNGRAGLSERQWRRFHAQAKALVASMSVKASTVVWVDFVWNFQYSIACPSARKPDQRKNLTRTEN